MKRRMTIILALTALLYLSPGAYADEHPDAPADQPADTLIFVSPFPPVTPKK